LFKSWIPRSGCERKQLIRGLRGERARAIAGVPMDITERRKREREKNP